MVNIFKVRSIRKKILLVFAVIIALYSLTSIASYNYMNEIRNLAGEVIPHSERINSLHEFAAYLESFERNIDKFFTVGYEEYHEKANDDLGLIYGVISGLKSNADDDLLNDMEGIESLMEEIEKNEEFLARQSGGEIDSAEMNKKIILIYNDISTVKGMYNELISENTEQLNVNVIEQNNIINITLQYIAFIGFSTFIVGILFSLFLSKSISKSIIKLRDATNEIGKGKLDTKIDMKSKDEIGELASAFNQMTMDLKQSQEQIKRHAKELEQKIQERTKDLDEKVSELTSTKTAVLNMMEDMDEANKELVRTQEELKESLEELKEMDIKKDQFISIAAHELKTPLTSIHGFSQLLQNRQVANNFTKRNKYLRIMDHETKRLAKLVTDILDLSRIDLGTVKLAFEEINLNQMMDDIRREMDVQIKTKGLKSEYDIEKDLPKIKTEREKLTEIIINLINNAVKYTPKGEITVKVTKEKGNVHFSIKDTGIGISKENQEKIFERFYQVDSSFTRKAGGTGLGLALCKEFLSILGGKIWLKSEEGKGSEFHFTLPIKRVSKVFVREGERKAKEALKKAEETRKKVKKTGIGEMKP